MLRVTVDGGDAVPTILQFSPTILIASDGIPAKGQVLLAETIGTFLFVLIVLSCKHEIETHGRD